MISKKGFVLILVVAFLAVMVILVWGIVNIGCSEVIQARAANDYASAYNIATAGAELLYAKLKSLENKTVIWPQSISSYQVLDKVPGGRTVGTFNAVANTVESSVFGIVSEGTVNGRTARVTVKYGFDSPLTNGAPLGCIGPMDLKGQKGLLGFRSWVRAEGPLASNSTITENNYVQVNGDVLQYQNFIAPSFWLNAPYDTNNNGAFILDRTGDNKVSIDDATSDAERTEFANDDINGDGVIDGKDAFTYYYTVYLNSAENNKLHQDLGINKDGSAYYTGTQTFDPWSVPLGTPIVFVDGDVNITFNDTAWWGGSGEHTIVATGNINIVQPTNGTGDVLTLIAFGDVNTGGVRAFGGVRGELVVYANNNFNAYYGGRTDGTIFAGGDVNIDTLVPIPGLLNRDINKGDSDWSNPDERPLGLPPGYNMISTSFKVQNESSTYKPKWNMD